MKSLTSRLKTNPHLSYTQINRSVAADGRRARATCADAVRLQAKRGREFKQRCGKTNHGGVMFEALYLKVARSVLLQRRSRPKKRLLLQEGRPHLAALPPRHRGPLVDLLLGDALIIARAAICREWRAEWRADRSSEWIATQVRDTGSRHRIATQDQQLTWALRSTKATKTTIAPQRERVVKSRPRTWEKQALSARGLKWVGRHSEYAI